MHGLDGTDKKILNELQNAGRLSNQDLADRIHLTASPCLRRVKHLEDEGFIEGYRAVLSRRKIGLGLTVFLEIKVDAHGMEGISNELQEALHAMPEIVSLHIVSGKADFLAEVVVPDLRAYEQFLMGKLLKHKSIKEVQSNVAIRSVKGHSPLPLDHLNQ